MEKLPCKNTFDMTVTIVINAVRDLMHEDKLSEDNLLELEKALTIGNNKVEAFCHSIHERCMSKSKLDLMVPPRTNAYGRIMVQPLEKLLDRKHRHFSEKQLSNYFYMISTILGRETYENYHDQLSELLRSEIRDLGSNFTWDDFFNHPICVCIRLETLGRIALAFDHFEQRMNWFLNVMEGSLNKSGDGAGTMQFTEHQAHVFLMALFDECINMKPSKQDEMKQILDEKEHKAIAHLIAKLVQM